MKTTYKILVGILAAALVLQGCVKDYIKPIPAEDENKQEVVDDDITKALKAIEGVSGVEKLMVPDKDGNQVANYFFYYLQPIDHTNPQVGSYNQHVAMQLSELKAPVVVNTQGYMMEMKGEAAADNDLRTALGANWVEIEHRYFENSMPEPVDSVRMNYLYTVQAACDIHRVVEMLQKNLFKNNVWVATGVSKGGVTTGLQAYYSDMYGWKDFDLFVPFCAPFLAGTPDSPTDTAIGKYLVYSCGTGYPADSEENKAYIRLQKILQQVVAKPRLRNEVLRRFHMREPDNYQRVLDVYGPKEPEVLCAALNSFQEALLGDYAELRFSSWAPLIPDPDLVKAGPEDGTTDDAQAIDAVCDFFFSSSTELAKKLEAAAEEPGTKARHTEEEMIAQRATMADMAYFVQSVRELGCVGIDYSWIRKGSFITPQLALEVADKASGRARSMDFYEGQWDGGKLMSAFRKWVYTETTQKMVFVYGSDDPWTGGAIDYAAAEANPNVVFVLNPGGIHADDFLNDKQFTKEATAEITRAVSDFLK